MVAKHAQSRLRLRPHHLFCGSFLHWDLPERGEAFVGVELKIRQSLGEASDIFIEVVEGVDDLCAVCPVCHDGRCQSPHGDEGKVRKWDAIILKGVGLVYGKKAAAAEFRVLVREKAPLAFCQTRCRLREVCSVSSAVSGG